MVREQQRKLAVLGLYRSKIDGIAGPHTQAAIQEFCELEQVAGDWEQALYEKVKRMRPREYLTAEIELLLAAYPNPMVWSDLVRTRFREHAKTYFLPALLELNRYLYLPMPEHTAYMMAIVEHETFGTYLPVTEAFYVSPEARSRYLSKKEYGDRWCARGHVGLTWEFNYLKYSQILNMDLVAEPELALDPAISLFILVHGMKTGTFTGRGIEQYINPQRVDFVNARRVVNKLDEATAIAAKAAVWLKEIQ